MYIDYRDIDENVNTYQKYEKIIQIIKKRFLSYGYKRIKTPAFEQYDLYSQVNSSVNQKEMIKVIDYTGDVLVIRPDVTIPITRKLAQQAINVKRDLRYFYVQDVFRQTFDQAENIESTHAGIEYFGNRSPEADAEVIALAVHILTDLGFKEVKIEIGHAGFFQELIRQIDLTEQELIELKKIIQAKNVIDIKPFLERLKINDPLANAIEKIPFLYGNPIEVAERAKDLLLTNTLTDKLNHLLEVYEIIKMYGLKNNVIMDLGLINHMGYYSDIIFQGFVENFGKPVLMGGRYDQLATEFGRDIPAIGFACEVESLVSATSTNETLSSVKTDILLLYDKERMQEAIHLANQLRSKQYSVVSYSNSQNVDKVFYRFIVSMDKEGNVVELNNEIKSFSGLEELVNILEGGF